MEVVATSLIAVLGTLLGSLLTHLFQRRTALHTERFTRGERLRQERVEAYGTFAGALANYRRGQMDYWFARERGRLAEGETLHEVRREAQRLRATALEAMFRAEMLTPSPALDAAGRDALRAVDRISSASDQDELQPAREDSRTAIYHLAAASRRHIPGLTDPGNT
ncbi:hypothetical protein GTW43_15970 [Streptomyces sp. SID5785]|uniref:hypothetical protein n=1 Tax=Streptomyces sp. SID5785 TaxID=2690309 RepID=UPI0013611C75|nr:hypothetical protein [Streptomyces sp. SID5785]MZD06581.1 hypothetical protein [Streptomyces sp. SID5785]